MPNNRVLRIMRVAFSLAVVATFVGALLLAQQYAWAVRQFPTFVSLAGLAFGLIDLVLVLRARPSPRAEAEGYGDLQSDADNESAAAFKVAARYFGWMIGFLGLIALVSYPIATALFVAGFYRLEASTSWRTALLAAAAATALIVAVSTVLSMHWPPSVIGF